ncbi:MAG: Rne/Rng family ribonuclease [Terriglobia bacterium]
MSKELVISASPHETKVALLEDGQVVEVSFEREKAVGQAGSIYKGRVSRVLPGMQSAFVNIGLERDAFLYVSDFFEDREEYERILASAEESAPQAAEQTTTAQPAPEPESEEVATAPPPSPREQAPVPEATPALAAPGTEQQRRRLGRRSYRGRRRGRRGGRGHHHGRFPSRPHPPEPRSEPEPYEPLILAGESLAKYKDRLPPPEPDSEALPAPTEAAPAPADESAESKLGDTESPPPEAESPTTQPSREQQIAEPEPSTDSASTQAEPLSGPASSANAITETEPNTDTARTPASTPRNESEAQREARRKQETDYIPVAEVDNSESAGNAASETSEGEAEAPEDFGRHEERSEEANGEVALPPSVRERTAGGVEWERPLQARRRGRRLRPLQARRRRRPTAAPGPRAKISDLLRPGQETIVQITKEQIGTKGARITSHVTLPGRYVVYMPTIEHIGVSRRIHPDQERARLHRLLLELQKGIVTGGFVVRTAAEGVSEEEIRRDLTYLVNLWRDIVQRAEQTSAPVLLHRDLGLMERILRDQLTADFETIWIDSEEEYTKAVEFVSRFQPALAPRVKLYTKEEPIFEGMGVQQEIERALKPKVWLKSGGYIVINHTEALVAIDVNTGKFVGKGSTRLEDTIVRTNLDAVKEIVRQIRLRDLGGIIIIDFIDMEDRRNRRKVMQELERALRSDRSPSKTLAFNEFGLIAITRKRVRQSLEKALCQPCPYCTGTGMLKSVPTLCHEIQVEAKKMACEIDAPELTIRAHPEVAKVLKARESGLLRELEEQTGKNVIVQPDQTLHFDQYNIF